MVGLARSSLQYRPTPRDDDALRLAIIRLAKQYGRYGYRKISCFEDLEHAIRGNSHRTVIDLGDHDRIVLVGVDEHKIDESGFIF